MRGSHSCGAALTHPCCPATRSSPGPGRSELPQGLSAGSLLPQPLTASPGQTFGKVQFLTDMRLRTGKLISYFQPCSMLWTAVPRAQALVPHFTWLSTSCPEPVGTHRELEGQDPPAEGLCHGLGKAELPSPSAPPRWSSLSFCCFATVGHKNSSPRCQCFWEAACV